MLMGILVRAAEFLRSRLGRSRMHLTSFALARPFGSGVLDRVELDPCGVIRVIGWSKTRFDSREVPRVALDAESIPFLQHYRVARPDVVYPGADVAIPQLGLVLEYLVPEPLALRQFESISIALNDEARCSFEGVFEFVNPHYRDLFDAEQVYHRDNIYGSGPPNQTVNPDTLALARELSDPILDFGCGSGVLIQELQALGFEAHGLELGRQMIRESLRPGVSSSITLYDGQFPSPFPSDSFKSVFCSEVLEHIPDFEAAIRDIARLATEKVIFTVPDASAIPTGFRQGVVPWHLLEGTHVNFFTQTSFARALQPYFSRVEFGRLGPSKVNDTFFHVSLVAACLK
jgi:SAM-dependent methyltransferase